MARAGYGSRYRRRRAEVLADGPLCAYGCGRLATTTDHVPPLADFEDPEAWEGELVPCCRPCNLERGGRYGAAKRYGKIAPAPTRSW